MIVVRLAAEHVDDVARLHCAELTGLLSKLGFRAARAFYSGCTGSRLAVGFVATEGGEIAGFVLGSSDPGNLRRDVLRRNPAGVATGTLAGLMAHPSAAPWLLRSLRPGGDAAYDRRAAELIYLAVAPGARGGGLGRELVGAFAAALGREGIDAFELSVDEDNPGAIRFYESLGMRRVGLYREFGRLHARYRGAAAGFSTS